MTIPKSCSTCEHRRGSFNSGQCALSGYYITTERQHPTKCDKYFSGWVMRLGVGQRLKLWWKGGAL